MDNQAFTGGIKPGGLTEDYEIKILICYLLHHLGKSMSFHELNDILLNEGVANYFAITQAISKLLASGHIALAEVFTNEERYQVTDLGVKTSLSFEKSIPVTVREGTLRAAEEYLLRQKLERENQVSIKRESDGYTITLRLTDIGSDLMQISLFVPSEEECQRVKERFLSDPATIYRGMLALLTGDSATVRTILNKTLSENTASVEEVPS